MVVELFRLRKPTQADAAGAPPIDRGDNRAQKRTDIEYNRYGKGQGWPPASLFPGFTGKLYILSLVENLTNLGGELLDREGLLE